MARIGIFYHSDPAGHVPSGIDSFIRGILQWAPPDLEYVLFGATSDTVARPVGREISIRLGEREVRYLPLVSIDPSGTRDVIPLTVRYMRELYRLLRSKQVSGLDILDFHRIEPSGLFYSDRRPKNVILHQDMSILRDKNSDIRWRHFPWLYEQIEGRLFSRLQRIFSVRQTAVTRYAQLYPRMSEKFAFIPTWVDTSTYHASDASVAESRETLRRELGVGAATPLLVSVGRLDRQKDPLLLLGALEAALQHRPDLHLVMIGDGILRANVEEVCRRERLQGHVTITGALNRSAIANWLRAADLFVMSSAYEGMPIAVLEALATGVPVVSTDVGELRLVVRDGINGYLTGDRTASSLSELMLRALGRLGEMRGSPCKLSVVPYHPDKVLSLIYDNHRKQASGVRRVTEHESP